MPSEKTYTMTTDAQILETAATSIDHGTADVEEIEVWLDNPMRCTAGAIMEKAARQLIAQVRECGKRLSHAELCVDAVNEIRTLLLRENVPTAAFVDDHVRNVIAERNQLRDALQVVAGAIEENEKRHYLREPDWNPEAHCEPVTLQVKDARRIFDLLEGKYDTTSMIELH